MDKPGYTFGKKDETPPVKYDLNELAERIHQTAVDHGWWEADRNVGEMLALMHSEISEALEEWRAHKPDVYFENHMVQTDRPFSGSQLVEMGQRGLKPEGFAIELADCIIRILDTLHSRGVDINAVVLAKMAYNDTRPYRHGGKRA